MDARTRRMMLGGAALVALVAAVALFLVDADPTWLFQSPIASGALVLLAIALGVAAWRAGPTQGPVDDRP